MKKKFFKGWKKYLSISLLFCIPVSIGTTISYETITSLKQSATDTPVGSRITLRSVFNGNSYSDFTITNNFNKKVPKEKVLLAAIQKSLSNPAIFYMNQVKLSSITATQATLAVATNSVDYVQNSNNSLTIKYPIPAITDLSTVIGDNITINTSANSTFASQPNSTTFLKIAKTYTSLTTLNINECVVDTSLAIWDSNKATPCYKALISAKADSMVYTGGVYVWYFLQKPAISTAFAGKSLSFFNALPSTYAEEPQGLAYLNEIAAQTGVDIEEIKPYSYSVTVDTANKKFTITIGSNNPFFSASNTQISYVLVANSASTNFSISLANLKAQTVNPWTTTTTSPVGSVNFAVTDTTNKLVQIGSYHTGITVANWNIGSTISYNSTTYTVAYIQTYAFLSCSDISGTLNVPGTVKIIKESAFRGTSITSATTNSGTLNIKHGVFMGCSSLTTVKIAATVNYLGGWIFASDAAINTVYFYTENAIIYAYYDVNVGSWPQLFTGSQYNYGSSSTPSIYVAPQLVSIYKNDTKTNGWAYGANANYVGQAKANAIFKPWP